jgi:hypothetical protein
MECFGHSGRNGTELTTLVTNIAFTLINKIYIDKKVYIYKRKNSK